MALPDYQSLMRPLLEFAADGQEKNIGNAVSELAQVCKLTDEDLQVLLPSGKQTLFSNRVHWAKTYLDKAGALRRTKRGYFEITERGRQLLRNKSDKISNQDLRQYPEFIAFQGARVEQTGGPTQVEGQPLSGSVAVTPEEAIARGEMEIQAALRAQLLERIRDLPPVFFEKLVVDLIVSMGYGGTRERVIQSFGKTGDEGIDGVVNEDPLGLDVVYIQAKRYAADNGIGRERIQQFAGALVGQGASKGVFVATSYFTKGAIEYAHRVPQRLILIDGNELTQLMIRYGVGVRTERIVEIKRMDLDYFDDTNE